MGQDTAGKRTRAPKATETAQILLKADNLTVTMTADKDGKVRLRSQAWTEPVVLLDGQRLEARFQAGQVVLLRRETEK